MAHFMNNRGARISKSIQNVAVGQSLTIGVYGAAGLTVAPNASGVAKITPQGNDGLNFWYVLEASRRGHVMVEAKKGAMVWDSFQLAVGAETQAASAGPKLGIRGSVGAGGDNHMEDVVLVTTLLNDKLQERKRDRLPINSDGSFSRLHAEIQSFQRDVLGLRGDGRVDPGGATMRALQSKGLGISDLQIEEKWKRDQPAPLALKRLIQMHVPMVKKIDIYAPRNIAASTSVSMHAYGCAIDLYLSASVETDRVKGDFIFDCVKKNASEMRLGAIIWNRMIYSGTWSRLTPYTGPNPHTDHLHLEWSTDNSQQTYWPSFEADLAAGASPPLPTAPRGSPPVAVGGTKGRL